MKEKEKLKYEDSDMNERERNINKSKLDQINNQSPIEINRANLKLDKAKPRNHNLPKPHTYDIIAKRAEESEIQRSDLNSEVHMPNIKQKEIKTTDELFVQNNVLSQIQNLNGGFITPNSRNFHFVKTNTEIKQKISTRNPKESLIQNGKACIEVSYLKPSTIDKGHSFDSGLPTVKMPSGGNPENPLKQNNTILNLNENTGEKNKSKQNQLKILKNDGPTDLEKILNNRIKSSLKLDSISMVNSFYGNSIRNQKAGLQINRERRDNITPNNRNILKYTINLGFEQPKSIYYKNHHLARSNILNYEADPN